jgi:hypothetical protein
MEMHGRKGPRSVTGGREQGGRARRPARSVALRLAVAVVAIGSGATLAAAPLLASPPTGGYAPSGPKIQTLEKSSAAFFGRGVSLSADGTTAIVGAPHENGETGAAYIFERTGSTWAQTAKLEVGSTEGSAFFGRGVALSADGSTALVGDPGNSGKTGSAWVFVRSGSSWILQQRLGGVGESGAGQFGRSVSLSADGSTAMVGGFADAEGAGAVWAFDRSGSTWTPDGGKITATGEVGAGWFGRSVSLSAGGTTALVGASKDAAGTGAVFVLERGAGGWAQKGSKLTATGESGAAQLGESVALSADGTTALAGAPSDEGDLGAAFVFADTASGWQQQGHKLTGGGESGAAALGRSTAISGDGATALVGGGLDSAEAGAAWVYERTGTTWSQVGAKLTGTGEVGPGHFGSSLALSADASTALVGGIADQSHTGAAWPFARVLPPEEPPATSQTESTPAVTTPASTTPTTPPAHGVAGATFVASPVLAVSGNVQPISGKVLIKIPGQGFEPLSGLRQIPFGSTVDATEGHVQVTTALPQGGQETGEFFAGEFVLTQARNGVVTLKLTGGSNAVCAGTSHGRRTHNARRRHNSRRLAVLARRSRSRRKLWSNAHGTFTTKGSYAAGAVQGTEWLTEDRCNGTFIRVTRDKVKVTDLVRHRTFIVRAGHSIFVKA